MEPLPNYEHDNDVSDLPVLPQQIRTMNGQIVNISSNKWQNQPLDRRVCYTINWNLLEEVNKEPILSQRALYLAKLYIIYALSKRVWRTAEGYFYAILAFERWLSEQHDQTPLTLKAHSFNWSDLNETCILAFRSWRSKQTINVSHSIAFLRGLYGWGVARRYPDFSPDTLRLLKSIRIAAIPRGRNVRIRDPLKGPFTPDEVLLITNAIKNNRGADWDRVLVMLHLELGINPYASVQLLNRHLRRYESEGFLYYQLDVPRIKKRTAHLETKRRPISNELGNLLMSLQKGKPEEPLLHWLKPSRPGEAILHSMYRFAKAANLKSPRTGTLLKLHPRRFRYTLATSMAEEGASKHHIAEVLDHTDLQCVNVYVETASSISEAVAKATDPELQPIVHRFLGKILDSSVTNASPEASNAVIPTITPHLPVALLNLGGVGVCGRDVRKDGLCRLFPPLSCYLCPSFAALQSGPHEELLESLNAFIAEMEGVFDKRILSQLDNIRLALKEVIGQLKLDAEKQQIDLIEEKIYDENIRK